MKRMYFSTLKRVECLDNPGGDTGLLYCFDWDSKQVLKTVPVVAGMDPNAPGKSHGCRGITFHDGKLYVAWWQDNISVFAPDTLERLYDLSFPGEFKATHQLKSHDGSLWVVSTGNNTFYQLRDDKIVEAVNLKGLDSKVSQYWEYDHLFERDWDTEDKLHFNSIGWHPDGDMYHVYFEVSMVYNWTKQEIVYQGEPLHHPHDILFLDRDRFVVSSSNNFSTVAFSRRVPGEVRYYEFNRQPHPDNPEEKAAWVGHTRGLACAGDSLFACSAPGRIDRFRRSDLVWRESGFITEVPFESIYDIVLDPRDW